MESDDKMFEEIIQKLYKIRLIPVVIINDSKNAIDLVEALIEGGLPCVEITFRTEAAEESISLISKAFPEMLIGAGTVLSVNQVKRAVNAGADFIVSPGFDAEVVDYCLENNIPIFPGCVTPSEITQAFKRGLKIVKFFPATLCGGVKAMSALAAPFNGIKFIPTGGVSDENIVEFLKCKYVVACGGSWMVRSSAIEAKDYDGIKEMVREAVYLAKKVK